MEGRVREYERRCVSVGEHHAGLILYLTGCMMIRRSPDVCRAGHVPQGTARTGPLLPPSARTLRTLPLPPSVGPDRKYFLLGGKGGVGKTSCSASLAVKFAAQGLPTLVVSTDPAHSLSDSVDQVWTYVWG